MEISKTLRISTLDDLYNLIQNESNLLDSSKKLSDFYTNMFEYYHGCPCFEEDYLDRSTSIFDDIKIDPDTIDLLKKYYRCNFIAFS